MASQAVFVLVGQVVFRAASTASLALSNIWKLCTADIVIHDLATTATSDNGPLLLVAVFGTLPGRLAVYVIVLL